MLSIAEAGAAQTAGFLLDAGRINRVAWQHARDRKQPGVQVLGQLLQKPGSATRAGLRHRRRSGATGANWVVASLLNLLDGGKLHPQVTAEVRQSMRAGAMAAKNPGKGVTADSRKQAADRIPPTWPMNAASSCVHYPLCHQARRYEKAQSC
jgi:hypothetical protein